MVSMMLPVMGVTLSAQFAVANASRSFVVTLHINMMQTFLLCEVNVSFCKPQLSTNWETERSHEWQ